MRGLVEALVGRILAGDEADLNRFDRVGLVLLFLQLVEDLGRLIGRRGPDDLQPGEGEREQHQLGLQVGRVRGGRHAGRVVGEGVEGEGFLLVEFDEEHRVFVVLQHRLGLVEQPPVFERGDEIAYGFALDADLRREHVVADSQRAGYDDHGPAVEQGGQRGAEFSHVNDHAGGLGRGGEATATSDTRVDRSQELFLWIIGSFAIKGEGEGHLLREKIS